MGSKVERENAFLPFSSLPPSIFCIFQEVALFYKERVSEKRHNRRRTERFLLNNFGFGIVGLFIEIPSGDGLIIAVAVVGQFITAPPPPPKDEF